MGTNTTEFQKLFLTVPERKRDGGVLSLRTHLHPRHLDPLLAPLDCAASSELPSAMCAYILSQACLSSSLGTNKDFLPTPGHSLPPLVLTPPWEAMRQWLGPGDLCRNSSINAQTMAQEAPVFNVPEGLHSCS